MAAAQAAFGMALGEIWQQRGGKPQDVTTNVRNAVHQHHDGVAFMRQNGQPRCCRCRLFFSSVTNFREALARRGGFRMPSPAGRLYDQHRLSNRSPNPELSLICGMAVG